MIDTDNYEDTDHPELVEFAGETLGDTLTNLITEIIRLREENKKQHDVLSTLDEMTLRGHENGKYENWIEELTGAVERGLSIRVARKEMEE